jgi:hypothetical protein
VPVVIEQVDLPLAFKRIESAMMIGWHGEPDHPELDMLYRAIENKIHPTKTPPISSPVIKPKTENRSKSLEETNRSSDSTPRPLSTYAVIAGVGLLASMGLLYYYLHQVPEKTSEKASQQVFYIILVLFGIACSALVFGLMNTYATLNGKMLDAKLKMTGPGVGVMLIVLGGLYLPPTPIEKTIDLFGNGLDQGLRMIDGFVGHRPDLSEAKRYLHSIYSMVNARLRRPRSGTAQGASRARSAANRAACRTRWKRCSC